MRRLKLTKAAEFRETIDKVVSMLTERGLKVTQVGVNAYVSYNIDGLPVAVNIPSVPDSADDAFLAAIRGFIDHEVGHVLETDGPAIVAAAVKNPKSKNLVNIVEDVRIERAMQKRFGGSAAHLNDVWTFIGDKQILPAAKAAKSDEELYPILLPSIIHAWAGKRASQELMDRNNFWPRVERLTKTLAPFKAELERNSMRSTKDAIDLAERIFTEMQKAAEPPKKEPPAPPPPPSPPEKEEKEENKDEREDNKPEQPEEPEKGEESEEKDQDQAEGDPNEGDSDEPQDGETEEKPEDEGEGEAEPEAQDEPAENEAGSEDAEEDKSEQEEAEGKQGESEFEDKGQGEDEQEAAQEDDGAGEGAEEEKGSTTEAAEEQEAEASDDEGEGTASEQEVADEGEGAPEEGETAEPNGGLIDSTDFLAEVKDTEHAFENSARDAVKHTLKNNEYLSYTKDYDKFVVVTHRDQRQVDAEAARMDVETQQLAGQLANHFRRLFAQQEYTVNYGGQRRGRLNTPQLFRLSMNDVRVFARREEHTATNTAVTLLIDNSGSMDGAPVDLALTSANIFSATLEKVNIVHEVLGFTTHMDGKMDWSRFETDSRALGRPFSRFEPIVMPIYKEFNEPYRAARPRLAAMRTNIRRGANVQLSSNIDGESVEYAAIRLAQRPEPRKVLIVFSDGQPAGGGVGPHLQSHLRDTVKRLNAGGIETLGVGILTDVVKRYYDKFVVIQKIGDLPVVVMKELEKLLIR